MAKADWEENMNPAHRCQQEKAIEAIQGQLANGKQDFRELRQDIKDLLQGVAAVATKIETVMNCLDTMETLSREVATLKGKSSVWGAVAGFVAAVVVAVIGALAKRIF